MDPRCHTRLTLRLGLPFGHCAQLKVRDIEELVQLGEKQRACPYYGTRAAVPSVEVRAQSAGAGAPLARSSTHALVHF